MAVPDFMSREAPPNYIAGLGRGATGFTTRSDLGSVADDGGAALATAQAAAQGKGKRERDDDDFNQYEDPDNETGLFNGTPYEREDEEADRIYREVEQKMDERRRARREAKEKEELEKFRKEKPKIQEQFADLKKGLKTMSEDEWASIPEVQDMVRKRGQKKVKVDEVYGERLTSMPDTILLSNIAQTQFATSLDTAEQSLGVEGTSTDFNLFREARDRVLGVKLDQAADSVQGQTNVNSKGYLTDLGSVEIKSDTEISDIKKARTLLQSVIQTNPKHGPGWIAAARLEEVATKLAAARDIIGRGCEACPESEDVWLEAARLNNPDAAKVILANAVRHLPQSVNIWMRAKDLETDRKVQKRILRRALEYIPNSVAIWKAAISLEEDSEDAKVLLSRAVECVPLSVELWLALANLETYQKAQTIINKALKANPTSHEVWLAGAKLEEQNNTQERVEKLIKAAVARLRQKGAMLDREQWLKEAIQCEKEGFLGVCKAIIKETVSLDVEEEELKTTLLDDAENTAKEGAIATARLVYEHAISLYPDDEDVWQAAAFFEKEKGTKESLERLLEKAVEDVPEIELLWLMWAKDKWLSGDVDGAKAILQRGFDANPNSEEIWLAAIKLEIETKEYENAKTFLAQARQRVDSDRVWMKSAVLERILKNYDEALQIVEGGIKKFPTFEKLWIMKGQILQDDKKDFEKARIHYALALKTLPKSIILWKLASNLEEQLGVSVKARAILERARILNPKNADLWTEAVNVEQRAGNAAMAKVLLAKGIQECPSSGSLWCLSIVLENKPQRRARSQDAMRSCDNDPQVIVTIARLFWSERKNDKARNWFQRAVKINPDLGDSWAWWYKFECSHGTKEQQQEVIEKCTNESPHHGPEWQIELKRLENIGKPTSEIIKIVSAKLKNNL
ncbi:hypothetical protein HDV04_000237 [Boothiomyces sp. JEL0838]|nr:hypothetical protein HDV04_000237 [Boothiomyces sp. JEL0838]